MFNYTPPGVLRITVILFIFCRIEKIDHEPDTPTQPPLTQAPPSSHISPATPSQASPLTQAPPSVVPTHIEPEKSKPGKKKTGKGKPATANDLLSLHKEVARNNQQLIEPTTPDFKPTTEWVRVYVGVVLVIGVLNIIMDSRNFAVLT